MGRRHGAGIFFGLGFLLAAPSAILGQSPERALPERTPVASTPHFAFYSDVDANVNDALIAAGEARRGKKDEIFRSGTEVSCFEKLPPSSRAAWDAAVSYYEKIVSSAGSNDRQRYLLRAQLAGFDEDLKDAGDRVFVEIARNLRAAAKPAYTACRWAAQDEKNRRWIGELKPRLADNEEKIALRLEQLYQKRWSGLPIPVDVVETVDWSGANTILRDPAGGHLLISNAYEGLSALEVVFHESSHLFMGRNAPLRQALDTAAREAGFRLPGDLWHVVLFYTTGEAVRRILDDAGKTGYTPMLYAIFDRGAWAGYRGALESAWRPYLDGKQTLPETASGLIAALRMPGNRNEAGPSTGARR